MLNVTLGVEIGSDQENTVGPLKGLNVKIT